MEGIIRATDKLLKIAQNFSYIANGQVDYIKYGNAFCVPDDFTINL